MRHSTMELTALRPNRLSRVLSDPHTRALILYGGLVLGHFSEHIIQLIQAFVLGMPRHQSMGLLGLWFPELMRTEVLHFSYNLVQLLGLLFLAYGFSGRARRWWNVAILLQGWHFFEHFLLQAQYVTTFYLFGKPRQTSIGELLLPRIELHFVYVTLAVIPTVIAIYLHFRQRAGERENDV